MSPRVLVTGLRAPVAIDCARAFSAAGAMVHGAESVTPWAARWSRGRWPIHRVPPPRRAFPAFRAAMRGLVDRHDISLVVPTCEEVFYVAAAAEADGWLDRLFAPPLATLRTLHSKAGFPAFARGLGLAAPETRRITDPAALAGLPGETLVLKPEFSRFAAQTLIRPDTRTLRKIAVSPEAPWVAQPFVAGEEICLWSAVHRGAVTAFAAYLPRWRQGRSAAYAFEAIDCPAAAEIAHRVAAATGMTGHLSFDIILAADGSAVPIECNPRAVSGLHLFDAEAELARAMCGEPVGRPPAGRLRHLAPAMLMLGLPAAVATGQAGRLLADWRTGEDSIGRPGDRAPAWGALIDAARFALVGLSRLRGPAGQTTDDIEWNGEPIG
jgi:hypothetical protein